MKAEACLDNQSSKDIVNMLGMEQSSLPRNQCHKEKPMYNKYFYISLWDLCIQSETIIDQKLLRDTEQGPAINKSTKEIYEL